MDQFERDDSGKRVIFAIIVEIRRSLALIIAIMIVAIGLGVAYAYTKVPHYTASETVVYEGHNSHASTTVNDYNAMSLYIDTMVDFCDEGVVIDRANFYYGRYLNEKGLHEQGYGVEDYIRDIKINDTYNYQIIGDKRIVKENITVEKTETKDDQAKFSFVVKYTDLDADAAVDKVKLLILAVEMESNAKEIINNEEINKYFDGIVSEFIDYGTIDVKSNVSKVKIMFIAVVGGALVACLAMYLRHITDNSVKDKTELEDITGADILAEIDYIGGKQNGRNKR